MKQDYYIQKQYQTLKRLIKSKAIECVYKCTTREGKYDYPLTKERALVLLMSGYWRLDTKKTTLYTYTWNFENNVIVFHELHNTLCDTPERIPVRTLKKARGGKTKKLQ